MNSMLDERNYISLLPSLRHQEKSGEVQRLEHHSDIYLRPASHTYMHIREVSNQQAL
jgi:hypothetical protein